MALDSLLKGLFGKPYTIGELMNIDGNRQGKAGGCSVSLVETFLTMKEESILSKFKAYFTGGIAKFYYITMKLAVSSDTGHLHYVFIQVDPDFDKGNPMGNHIKIYCDCPDFKYRSAYVLNKRNSLFDNDMSRSGLGQAINDAPTGKRGTTLLCKHAFAAVQWVMSNYSSVMTNL